MGECDAAELNKTEAGTELTRKYPSQWQIDPELVRYQCCKRVHDQMFFASVLSPKMSQHHDSASATPYASFEQSQAE
jgi:hypothetical protein